MARARPRGAGEALRAARARLCCGPERDPACPRPGPFRGPAAAARATGKTARSTGIATPSVSWYLLPEAQPKARAPRVWRALSPTLRYWMETEVHVFSFSVSANVLLSFFPFL